MRDLSVIFSHNSDDWATPTFIYSYVLKYNWYDPCPLKSSFDCLGCIFNTKQYINPPFSKMKQFVDYAINNLATSKEILFLMPVRTDTSYFKKLYPYINAIYFINGRLRFNDSNYAPFPTMILLLKDKNLSNPIVHLLDQKDLESIFIRY